MQVLLKAFKSYQKAFWPHTVILHGKPGVGKSSLARSIILGWAQGKLYQDMSYAFFFSVREIKWTEKSSLAELISEEWPYLQASVAKIMSKPERLLFVLDGFDDLDLALLQDDMRPSGDWEDEQPIYILMYSLLMKVLLPQSCLIITTRDTDLEKLKSLAVSPLYILVGGLSATRRTQLLLENISDDQRRKHVVRTVIENDQIFDQCQVPSICSLVCEALKLQEKLGERCAPVCWTLTSLYATLVFHQLTPREPFQSCLSHREQVALMGLCGMAAEGVWNMRSVFYDDDLQNYGLEEAAISALFHMNVLLRVDDSTEQYYIFFHLSLQDFCAALYYLLKGLKKWNQYCLFVENPKRNIMTLKRTNFNTHLLEMKRFLFGLMNKDTMRTLEALLGCPVSPAVKQRLQHWVFEVGQQVSATGPEDVLDAFYYLFESQDKEFVCWALNSFQEVWLQVNQKMDLMVSSYCLQHCQNLKTLRVDVRDIFLVDKNAELCPVALPQAQGKSLIMELWEDFCSVLSMHPKLNKLDLGSSVLNEWAMKILCLKLRNPACNIQNLMLKDAEIAAGLQYLWMTLVSNRNLKYLNLGNNNLKDDDIKLVCEALRHPNCSLETLRLDSCELTSDSYSMISELLLSSTSLKSLSLARNGVTEKSMGQLCGALSSSRCILQKLILNQCDLKRDACGFLALMLINNRTLTHLSLTKNPVVDDGVKFLCEAIKEPTCHLQELELVECWLTGDCCENLASMITMNQHLKSLDLGYNNLGDNGVIALCKGLKQNNSSLRRLGLEACGLTFESCEALSSTLASNQCLTSLNLVKNSFSTPGMLKLCYAFRHFTSNLRIIGLWKQQHHAEVRRQLEEIQLTRPHTVITGDWYSLEEDDRNWWKN
ncbi:NACHT, LRR and PYD domains-containing protein 5 [Microtus ochrogaster]|uniref:NACHT, LRR and PYD domains-containing protein 5 n=1 Tax=Microtus ochrogaster TaxID=79684 RepID=A0ABM1AX76_MICOH|nr:NACHT, LRR and PYD domains-containing protein 5 [Microtus ochrogaster]